MKYDMKMIIKHMIIRIPKRCNSARETEDPNEATTNAGTNKRLQILASDFKIGGVNRGFPVGYNDPATPTDDIKTILNIAEND